MEERKMKEETEVEITEKGEHLAKDLQFLKYNKKNCLINLLQMEKHIKAMNTMNFIEGEGSCTLKHGLIVRGEIDEATSHISSQLKGGGVTTDELGELPIFEKLGTEMDIFFKNIEGKHDYHKVDLINLVRSWRKDIEKTMPTYQTFKCKCIEQVPYLKSLIYVAVGAIIATVVNYVLRVVLG